MPTYDYECTKCGHAFELFQSMHDKPRSRCPKCRSKVRRVISGGLGVLFKGDGYYAKDSRKKNPPKLTGEADAGCDSCPAESASCPVKKAAETRKKN